MTASGLPVSLERLSPMRSDFTKEHLVRTQVLKQFPNDRMLVIQIALSVQTSQSIKQYDHDQKFPNITGHVFCKVWYTMFDDVACQGGWTSGKYLDRILTKFQNLEGELVFDKIH